MTAQGAISTHATQPIFLWAVPRSVSTAFEKTIISSRQFEVLHEPFTDCYYFGSDRKSGRYGSPPGRKVSSGKSTCRQILEAGDLRRFVKELCFQAEPYVDGEFISKVTSTFIIRSPDAVLASLKNLKPDFTEHEFGFTALRRIWEQARSLQSSPPLVVEGDQFRANPARVLRAFCEAIGAHYDEDMLSWETGRIRNWMPHEAESQAKWHATLEQSRGIIQPPERHPAAAPFNRDETMDHAWQIYRDVLSASAVIR
jgi:Sulfotransferase domain